MRKGIKFQGMDKWEWRKQSCKSEKSPKVSSKKFKKKKFREFMAKNLLKNGNVTLNFFFKLAV